LKNIIVTGTVVLLIILMISCNNDSKQQSMDGKEYAKGTFVYDLNFLKKQDSGLLVLEDQDKMAQVIISPKYQAKVFTSTADGWGGTSFGWINYKAFDGPADPHMNAYGGENRLWLGPEGGPYSLFFKPGSEMVFANWVTPPAFDSEPWTVTSNDVSSVALEKEMQLQNYTGTILYILVKRKINLLDQSSVNKILSIQNDDSLKVVAYQSENTIINNGAGDWSMQTGMPCIWLLDMLKPSPATIVAAPYSNSLDKQNKIATTDYFGEIPPDRIKYKDGVLLFKADGKSRGKLGLSPSRAKPYEGSYDPQNKILTIIHFDLDTSGKYLNQEWGTTKPLLSGDAVNAYNDGPLDDGSQMGPFYEMESVSPAAMLKSGESLSHVHSVFHFTGSEASLDKISRKVLGISLDEIKNAFQ
jgi:Family of unknown function (DUF6786)